MPWYRINGMTIHMRGTKLPKPCVARVGFSPQHGEGMVCMDMSAYLCDGSSASEGKTCDRPLCQAHATQIGKDKHLCPDCRVAHFANQQPSLFTSLVGTAA